MPWEARGAFHAPCPQASEGSLGQPRSQGSPPWGPSELPGRDAGCTAIPRSRRGYMWARGGHLSACYVIFCTSEIS